MRRTICISLIASAALALPAAASADDRSVAAAYVSQASTFIKQNGEIARFTRQWTEHGTGAMKAIHVLKQQRKTLSRLAGAVRARTASTRTGRHAKQLALRAIKANAQGDGSAIKAFVDAVHHRLSKASHEFKAASNLFRKAQRLDQKAIHAFRDAGVV
jgi:hypothetical protein